MKSKATLLRFFALVAMTILALTAASQAAVLAAYDFTSGSAAASTTGTGVTAGNFQSFDTTNEGAIGIDTGFSSTGGTTYLRSDATGSTQANALTDDDYFSVTISVTTPGEILNLTSLTLTLGGSSDGNGAVFTNQIYLLSSVDSFGSVIAGTGATASININTASPPFDMNTAGSTSFDLSALAYQGLSTITFNFRVSDDVNADGKITRFDDVTINGTVIPEPHVALLGGLGMLLLLRRRRY